MVKVKIKKQALNKQSFVATKRKYIEEQIGNR
jgi:hypothetical protein